MAMSPGRKILKKILRTNPCSLRALAREAELSHVHLIQMRDGKRAVTEDAAIKIKKALKNWSKITGKLAEELEVLFPGKEE
jgi:plasmid maintenance system antidote protein VapI